MGGGMLSYSHKPPHIKCTTHSAPQNKQAVRLTMTDWLTTNPRHRNERLTVSPGVNAGVCSKLKSRKHLMMASGVRWRCLSFVNKWRSLGSVGPVKPSWWEMNSRNTGVLGRSVVAWRLLRRLWVVHSCVWGSSRVSQSLSGEWLVCFAEQSVLYMGWWFVWLR